MRPTILLLVLFVLLAGCSQRDLPTPAAPEAVVLESAGLPEVLGPQQLYRIEVAVTGEVDSVRLEALRQGQSQAEKVFYLHDDGGALHPGDGDVVAFDDRFTQRILWQPALLASQNYLFRFQALRAGQPVGAALEATRLSGDLRPPVIRQIILPDTLQSGFAGTLLLQAMVVDSSGPGDIARVELIGSAPGKASFDTLLYDDGSHGDITANDGLFSLAVDRTFGAQKSGAYTLSFKATDRSDLSSGVKTATMVIVNGAPRLTDLVAPDQADRPISLISGHLVSLKVEEPQGLRDINRVLLRAYNPDGSGYNNNPFVMYDNGLALDINRWDLGYRGDLTAKDGIYSMTVIFDATKALGVYKLTIVAEDWAGNQSELLTHLITLN